MYKEEIITHAKDFSNFYTESLIYMEDLLGFSSLHSSMDVFGQLISVLDNQKTSKYRFRNPDINYLQYLEILQSRNHPFLNWLDKQEHYEAAFSTLGNKTIWWPYFGENLNQRLQDLIAAPLSIRSHFDNFIAKSFLAYSYIQNKGSNYFLKPNPNELKNITLLANKLLDTINNSSRNIS